MIGEGNASLKRTTRGGRQKLDEKFKNAIFTENKNKTLMHEG